MEFGKLVGKWEGGIQETLFGTSCTVGHKKQGFQLLVLLAVFLCIGCQIVVDYNHLRPHRVCSLGSYPSLQEFDYLILTLKFDY